MIFDTLKVSQKLRENGRFTEDQAVALAEAFSAGSMDNLATKADLRAELANLRTELKGDIASVRLEVAQLRTEVKTDMKDLENRLLLRMAAMFVFAFGGLAGFIHFVK